MSGANTRGGEWSLSLAKFNSNLDFKRHVSESRILKKPRSWSLGELESRARFLNPCLAFSKKKKNPFDTPNTLGRQPDFY